MEEIETSIQPSVEDGEPAAGPSAEAAEPAEPAEPAPEEPLNAEDLLAGQPEAVTEGSAEDARLRAVLEAVVYVADEPLSLQQIAAALSQPAARIAPILDQLVAEYDKPEHGLTVREVAGGYKMATKPEHHEAVRNFVKSLKPPLKLSLAALETLAVIAYKQPVTAPEIGEIRGVQGTGVLKTLLDRKLIAAAGRKNVIGKPILYKTTKEFLVQFGLKDLAELPTLKEFEEIGRMALGDGEGAPPEPPIVDPPEGEPAPAPPAGDPPPEGPDVVPPPPADPADRAQAGAETAAASEPAPGEPQSGDAEPASADDRTPSPVPDPPSPGNSEPGSDEPPNA